MHAMPCHACHAAMPWPATGLWATVHPALPPAMSCRHAMRRLHCAPPPHAGTPLRHTCMRARTTPPPPPPPPHPPLHRKPPPHRYTACRTLYCNCSGSSLPPPFPPAGCAARTYTVTTNARAGHGGLRVAIFFFEAHSCQTRTPSTYFSFVSRYVFVLVLTLRGAGWERACWRAQQLHTAYCTVAWQLGVP